MAFRNVKISSHSRRSWLSVNRVRQLLLNRDDEEVSDNIDYKG